MKNFTLAATLTVLFSSFIGNQSIAQVPDLKFMTYNIHKGLGAEAAIKGLNLPIHAYPEMESEALVEISKIINQEDPDVVAIQEIDHYWSRRATSNQLEKLMELTNHRYKYALFIPVSNQCFSLGDVKDRTCLRLNRKNLTGNALLSKYPLQDAFTQQLPMVDSNLETPRVLAKVRVKIAKKQNVNLIFTHLEVSSEQSREKQIDEIVDYSRSLDSTTPLVLIGDFNADPVKVKDETLFRKLKEAGFYFKKYKKHKTNTTLSCSSDIDHIGVKGGIIKQDDYHVVSEVLLPENSKIRPKGSYPKCESSRTLPPQASDHKPVTAIVRFDS